MSERYECWIIELMHYSVKQWKPVKYPGNAYDSLAQAWNHGCAYGFAMDAPNIRVTRYVEVA